MSDTQQVRAEQRRELERERTRLEIEAQKRQTEFTDLQKIWMDKVQKIDQERNAVDERLKGFEAFVENNKATGGHLDEGLVTRRKAKIQAEIDAIRGRRVELLSQAEVEMKPIADRVAEARKAVQVIKERLIGAQEFEEALKAEEQPATPG